MSAVEVYVPFAEGNDAAVGYRKTFNNKLLLRGFVASRHERTNHSAWVIMKIGLK